MTDLFNYRRREAREVQVGNLAMGGNNPIRVQSMTTTDTNDTEASAAQALRIIEAGGELVRLTTQGRREAENMQNIRKILRDKGVNTPLVADVHFNANVADVAARHTEKVRINPGNYVDPARKFIKLEYTDEEYAAELRKIEERFVPFLNICKEHGTAIRIGVNHGSLSDRIRNRYGDTPQGIVESCMEFLRICEREAFHNVVISIKASNTVVMVTAVRLLVETLEKEGLNFPLHLGVTEAGEGEDGRIKSAVGIGTLLADGIGDTIRVSLSEAPEAEIPVAKHLAAYITQRKDHTFIPGVAADEFCWTAPKRRPTMPVYNIGGSRKPVVVAGNVPQSKADYLYLGKEMPKEKKEGQAYLVDYDVWEPEADVFPIFPYNAIPMLAMNRAPMKFLVLPYGADSEEYLACLKHHPEVVVVATSNHVNRTGEQRALVHELWRAGIENPVIFAQMYARKAEEKEAFQLEAAADMGPLMIDGLCDGIWLMNEGTLSDEFVVDTAFSILQAARLRMSKTEYISCPGCGRTLYDLQSTIARIKASTNHLKGLKIGIMGCIVNGPGEMADADYGYVGAGPGKVSLYRGQECVERNIPQEVAVERLLALIDSDKNKQ